jgi:AMP-activated protein kinase-like protein
MADKTLHPLVHRYLDGEIAREALSPELQREADNFENWLRPGLAGARAPSGLTNRIMVSLPAEPATPWHQRALSLLVEPRRIRVRPITISLAAAVIAVLLLVPRAQQNSVLTPQRNPLVQTVGASAPEVYVQFVFAAPNAQSVAVAGDFNSWQTSGVALRDADGDGVWTGLVALRPGAHKYMFIVDGKEWVTDPGAERYVDDGFGMRNAVINVAAPARSL